MDIINARIERVMANHECPGNCYGFTYLKECLLELLTRELVLPTLKDIFESVANKYETNALGVERCIRHLSAVWYPKLKRYGIFSGAPTSRELVSKLVELIKDEENLEGEMGEPFESGTSNSVYNVAFKQQGQRLESVYVKAFK